MSRPRYTAAVTDRHDAGHGSPTGGVVVEEVGAVTPEIVDALGALLPQLSSSAPPPTERDVAAIVGSDATVLYVARHPDTGRIVGALTLVLFRIPTGLRAWVEDVVVDTEARGRGAGSALVEAALSRAAAAGSRTVELTSRPSRQDANRLYVSLGFEPRETNVYRRTL